MKIQKKLLLSFVILIVVFISAQWIYNLFFAKQAFIYEKSKVLEDSFLYVKKNFDYDTSKFETMTEQLQDEHGIRIIIFSENKLIYSNQKKSFNGIIGGGKFKNEDSEISKSDFSFKPKAQVVDVKDEFNVSSIQLKGKFKDKDKEINVFMSIPIIGIENSIKILGKSELYIILIVIIVSIILSFFMTKSITKPITNIQEVSKNISKMDFSYLADENVNIVELSDLAKSINSMSIQMEESMNKLNEANIMLKKDIDYQKQIEEYRKEFIAGVSHEMKTPLGLLQVYTEILLNSDIEVDKNYYYNTIIEETNKLSDMVTRMLEISSLDAGFTNFEKREMNFSNMIEDIIKQYEPILKDYKVENSIEKNLHVYGDIKYLEQAVKNIINNAVQYTDKGKNINITLKKENNKIIYTVFNEGKNIDEKNITHIWDAFYREDKARTRTSNNNVGLGLYLVKLITEKHNGQCSVRNIKDGVEFKIELKITNDITKI